MSRGLRRHALGWERPPLAAAADWLLAEHGVDLSGVIVALPGAQAGRRLRELLARRAQRWSEAWVPPRILTQGALVDELVGVDLAVAPRFARTLAWDGALESLSAVQRARVARTPRGVRTARDLGERIRLAETVRALHGRLAPQGLDFGALASGDARPQSAGEAARWEALAAAQVRYRELLAQAGLADPHEARLQAIEAGRVACELEVVLVGVADMNRLLVKLLEQIAERATALIAAPAELLEGFDEWGRLRTEFWRERRVPIALDAWHVVEKPVDQAAAVRDVLASFAGRFAVDEVVVGVADEQVTPYLKQTLGACGAEVRDAAGTPLERTRPFRALQAAARYAARRTFPDLAALARHADVEPLLGDEVDVVGALDDYHGTHLPAGVDGGWLGGPKERSQPVVANAHAALGRLLGDLDTPRAGTLSNWVEPTLAFLRALYGDRRLDVEEVEADRVLAGALERIAEVLAELAELPAQLSGPEVAAHEALELVLRRLEGEAVPPAPPRPGEPAIELSGWLELPLEDAPALIVTGFQDRQVPGSVQGDAFLPDGACRALGLPNNDDRLARDAYATTLIVETRPCAAFVTGRRSHEGDPHVPSRLAFQVGEDEVVERVRHFLAAADVPPPPPSDAGDAKGGGSGLARLADANPIESMSVSSFRLYLQSPYRFYLDRVLKLKSMDDRARELDPLGFGILAHDALEVFGKSELRDCDDAERLAEFLESTVHRLASQRYGESMLPAVALQVEQLAYRLRLFAQHQAQRAAQGWRIQYAEWKAPDEHALLDVDGIPMLVKGKIDRIDRNLDGRWAVWDYKTGEKGTPPDKAHRKGESWIDLQLPLYAHLTRALGYEGFPELGYVALGKKAEDVGFLPAKGWDAGVIEEALEAARDVVRCVRRGEFFERPGAAPKYEPLVAALFGVGLLDSDDEDEGGAA